MGKKDNAYCFFMFAFPKDGGLEVIKDLVADDLDLFRICGLILYTEKNPYVKKVLRDDDFWKSFDCLSGNNWPVFAVQPLKSGQVADTDLCSDTSYMAKIWNEKENMPILKDLEIKDSQLPLFIAFMWDNKNELKSVSIPIHGRNVDEVYHSIADIVKTIAKTVLDIFPENKGTENVFRNVKSALEALKFEYNVKNIGREIRKFRDALRVFGNMWL